jgi:hypothetical protein
LGKAFVIYPFIATFVIASPQIRNWIISNTFHTNDFTELVTYKKRQNQQAETPEHLSQRKQQEASYLKGFSGIMLTGLALSLASLAFTNHKLNNPTPLPTVLSHRVKLPLLRPEGYSLHDLFALPEGTYAKVTDTALYCFWALPAYAGLIAGSRPDPEGNNIELKENCLKTVWFGFSFMMVPRIVKPLLNKVAGQWNTKLLGNGENIAYLLATGASDVLYASMPIAVNLLLRKKRLAKTQTQTPQLAST